MFIYVGYCNNNNINNKRIIMGYQFEKEEEPVVLIVAREQNCPATPEATPTLKSCAHISCENLLLHKRKCQHLDLKTTSLFEASCSTKG